MRALLTKFIPEEHVETFLFRSGLMLYLAVIVLGSIPGAREEIGHVASGLVLHFTTYACIAFLLACGAAGNATAKALKAFCMVVAMGALDECIQATLPYRDGAVADWIIDVSAALAVALLFRIASIDKPAAAS
jgi:VanZ family protein